MVGISLLLWTISIGHCKAVAGDSGIVSTKSLLTFFQPL